MKRVIALVAAVPLLAPAADVPVISVARWPGDRTAAVSLTFDDAMNTHLDNAAPVLRKHGLKGTFFVSTGRDVWQKRLREWQQLSAEGHEIGSHTVNHPCLLEHIRPQSNEYTAAMMESEVRDSARTIEAAIGGRRGLTFAWPCGDMTFGPVAEQARNQALYFGYVAGHYFAARAYKSEGGQDANDINALTVHDIGVTEGKTVAELRQMAAPVLAAGRWAVFCFHGIGGEWLSTPTTALDELGAFLEQDVGIWTATFGDAIRYSQERKALRITAGRWRDGVVAAELEWPLDRSIYDVPLTLKCDLPATASKVRVTVDGRSAPAVTASSRLLINVAPGASKVVIDTR